MTGDIFIHAGDFTDYGKEADFLAFFKYLERLNFRYKIVISGNHEIILDNGCIKPIKKQIYLKQNPCSVQSILYSFPESKWFANSKSVAYIFNIKWWK